jgi:hypothetical protein
VKKTPNEWGNVATKKVQSSALSVKYYIPVGGISILLINAICDVYLTPIVLNINSWHYTYSVRCVVSRYFRGGKDNLNEDEQLKFRIVRRRRGKSARAMENFRFPTPDEASHQITCIADCCCIRKLAAQNCWKFSRKTLVKPVIALRSYWCNAFVEISFISE